VSVALVIQHAKCMRRVILPYMAYLAAQMFPHYLINVKIFEKKKKLLRDRMCIWFS